MHKLGVALVFSLVLLALTGAFAFTISAPNSVEVAKDSNFFFVKVYNDSQSSELLKVNFLSIAKYKISAPTSVPAGATADIKITVFNTSPSTYTALDSKLEVYLGKNLQEKNITLKMAPLGANSSLTNSAVNTVGGLFSFGSFFSETGTYSLIEWVVFWVLVIVAAILLIGFIARVVRRT